MIFNMEKFCSKCKKPKPIIEFSKDSSRKDNLCAWCKSCNKIQKKIYRTKNNKKVAKDKASYYIKNKERLQAKYKSYYKVNRSKSLSRQKEYYESNKRKVITYLNGYYKNKRKTDPNFAMLVTMREMVCRMVRNGACKSKRSIYYIGCTAKELRRYIESQFKEGMSWDNRSEWHIDHIIPLSAFDMQNQQHLLLCCHWATLRPLWRFENISKGSKYPVNP